MNFEFATAARIVFGEGRLGEVGAIVAGLGTRALVVRGGGPRADRLVELLRASGVAPSELRVAGEPTTAMAERGAEQGRRDGCDVVVALGGGRTLDAGKAVAALRSATTSRWWGRGVRSPSARSPSSPSRLPRGPGPR